MQWFATYPDGNYNRPARRSSDGGIQTSYVFCSKQTPTWIDRIEGRWTAARLQPGNSKAVFGASEDAYALYWAACHRAIVRDVYHEGDRLGAKLGYHFAGEPKAHELKEFVVASPFDVLGEGWPDARI
jgi:hypothetical protein